jgi:riboflavin biosynthesis pyrimidine reductase
LRTQNSCSPSTTCWKQLIRLGLLDEYYFVVQPIIFGNGGRLFKDGELDKRQDLKLKDVKSYHSGAVSLHYQIHSL